jgi:L-asparaginase II
MPIYKSKLNSPDFQSGDIKGFADTLSDPNLQYLKQPTELTQYGRAVIVDAEGRVLFSAGDSQAVTYYRSASKPLQALAVLSRKLDLKYGFSGAETAIMAGSHMGEEPHVSAILSALAKASLSEDDMVMAPAYPAYPEAMAETIKRGEGPRKAMHNCSGKHTGLMLLSKESGDKEPYWDIRSNTQREVIECISALTEFPKEKIGIGLDGCGVPVFAVPLYNMALSFRNLACPHFIKSGDDALREAAVRMGKEMNANPFMIRGTGSVCTALNGKPDIVAKSGRFGVYGIGIRSLGIGIAYKFEDGNEEHYAVLIKALLKKIGYQTDGILEDMENLDNGDITNDLGVVAGKTSSSI